jgi:broad specificity phosphatase PhoE
MRALYLVKHAAPDIDPGVPAELWGLSPEGEAQARDLARAAAAWRLRSLWCSTEPKAVATARIVGESLGLSPRSDAAFGELRMPAYFADPAAFEAAVQAILARPREAVDGAEPARDAALRFDDALARVDVFPAAVVAHGRVITAWMAHAGRTGDPFASWRSLPLAGWRRIDLDAGGTEPQ